MMKPGSPVHICVDNGVEEVGTNVLFETLKRTQKFKKDSGFLFRELLTLKKPEDLESPVPWAILLTYVIVPVIVQSGLRGTR